MDPKKLQALQKYWNSRLKASGFEDIEDDSGNLKTYASSIQHSVSADEYTERQDYFLHASSFVDSPYLKGRDNFMWKLYCEGVENTQIANLTGLTESRVSQILKALDRRLMRRD